MHIKALVVYLDDGPVRNGASPRVNQTSSFTSICVCSSDSPYFLPVRYFARASQDAQREKETLNSCVCILAHDSDNAQDVLGDVAIPSSTSSSGILPVIVTI
jgi:hypothetical protein